MRISIILPTVQRLPVGGYKVSYEFANHLSRLGHAVTVVHPMGALSNNAAFWRAQVRHLTGRDRAPGNLATWFTFDPGVEARLIPRLHERWYPDADITLLTGWSTVAGLADPPTSPPARLGRVAQLVMDYELWLNADPSTKARMNRALSRPHITRVAISRAVEGMLSSLGTPAAGLVTLGIDLDHFTTQTPPESRTPVIGFPLRAGTHKGATDAFIAAARVTSTRPDCQWHCFGGGRVPMPPKPIHSHGALSPDDLYAFYNRCSIFVLPSRAEGWGLPAAEAMACGAAVVTTANGGTEDFAEHDVNALVVPAGQPEKLADAVTELLDDRDRRFRLAHAGRRTAAQMTWTRATRQLAGFLDIPVG